MGNLDENETQEIEILTGAFMLMPKKVLDETGLLDETYFMYGEDIDLSYRIGKAGYKIYYYPHTRIIHYKGESTKKGSLNYVRLFYNAMIIFAQKHFSKDRAGLYILGLKTAIYVKALLALLQGFLKKAIVPLTDAGLIYAGMYLIKDFWESNIKHSNIYAPEYMLVNVPMYILIWLTAVFFSGGYDRFYRPGKIIRGLLAGTLFISAVYGFLPESFRFSRGMILMGMAWAILVCLLWRIVVTMFRNKQLHLPDEEHILKKRMIIVGSEEESKRVQGLLFQAGVDADYIGFVLPPKNMMTNLSDTDNCLGRWEQLKDIVRLYQTDELIFCAQDIASKDIIQFMVDEGAKLSYKIVPKESLSIIGSNSKNTAGDLYTIDLRLNLNEAQHRRNKRVLDIALSFLLLLFMPVLLFVVKKKSGFIRNIFMALFARKTWVAYAGNPSTGKQKSGENHFPSLPEIKKGVLSPLDVLPAQQYDAATIYRLNFLYAKDYTINKDLHVFWRALKSLGN